MEEKNQNRNQNPEQQQTPHKRRVRYKGTHPRNYNEKYKELNPGAVAYYDGQAGGNKLRGLSCKR